MDKSRADVALVERALAPSREKAKALIIAGQVYLGTKRIDKPGEMIENQAELTVKGDICPYVSRGGLKLEKAMQEFDLSAKGKICADIGASTGGFTDCMLKNGAQKVYAIDVGYGQLDWGLRNDRRVVVMERTNARYLKPDDFSEHIDMCSVDVSFISLKLIFTAIAACGIGEVVTLIKPQFEAGKDKVGKKGVVKDPNTHIEVIENVFDYAKENGYYPKGLSHSPIKGPEGNIEYIALYGQEEVEFSTNISKVVGEAHFFLDKN